MYQDPGFHLLAGCVTLDIVLSDSVSHQENGDNPIYFTKLLKGLNEIIYAEQPTQYLVQETFIRVNFFFAFTWATEPMKELWRSVDGRQGRKRQESKNQTWIGNLQSTQVSWFRTFVPQHVKLVAFLVLFQLVERELLCLDSLQTVPSDLVSWEHAQSVCENHSSYPQGQTCN